MAAIDNVVEEARIQSVIKSLQNIIIDIHSWGHTQDSNSHIARVNAMIQKQHYLLGKIHIPCHDAISEVRRSFREANTHTST